MRFALVFIAVLLTPSAYADAGSGQYGPFDYYNPPKGSRGLVETHHFGPKTELFLRQGAYCRVWGDYDYTLRAFPNHPQALVAMAEFLEKHPGCQPSVSKNQSVADLIGEIERGAWRERDADYYFQKGIEFAPQYAKTRLLYGQHLQEKRRYDAALRQYLDAEKIAPNSADVHYHLGKLYLETGEIAKALSHARRAYQHGDPPADLKQQLVERGAWNGR
ncbi:MAG TPA: tetratricopeptide repeat protein [Acidiferrobacterales bacterium]